VAEVAKIALAQRPASVEALLQARMSSGETVDEKRRALIAKIGENINVRRVACVTGGVVGTYVHTGSRVGAVVALEGGDEVLARDIAMHVAAINPDYLAPADVPAAWVEKEREIFAEQVRAEGKPPEMVPRIVEGKLRKRLGEVTLLGQPFVKDDKISVEKLLKQAGAEATGYLRYEVGAGIEKKQTDFAAEVMATVQGSSGSKKH
jgi:elongation factor Ts